jgi:hypothetical protein
MSKIYCPDCDTELNPLYAFERQNGGWKSRTHRLWHCPGCGCYLTPVARFTGRETRILTHSDGKVLGGSEGTLSNEGREGGTPVPPPVGRGSRR